MMRDTHRDGEAPGAAAERIVSRRVLPWAAAVVLSLLVVAVFRQVGGHAFVGFDDPLYVTENPHVRAGLTTAGASWAFTSFHASNWHPLTWLSHMLDVELFGLDAGWHHGVNALLHLANTIVLFLALRGMTGGTWSSAFAAAAFAVHPLHVESVAWVSERKDMLSTLFGLLAIAAYLRHARRPGVRRFLPVAMLFALALLCKPMPVTLPFVLLLLDWWPLGRFRPGAARSLALEKVPLLLLSAASCVVAYAAQHRGGALSPQEIVPVGARVANAAVSYAAYLGKTVWPASLAVFYPHPYSVGAAIDGWRVAAAAALLLALTWAAFRQGGRRPFVAVGWLWYLGTLVPVIGLVPVGAQALADRYTYVPLIGIFLAVAWGVPDALARWRFRGPALAASAGALLVALALASWTQAGYWRDSITLFTRAKQVTEGNWLASFNLGVAYGEIGRHREAVAHFREVLRIRPFDYRAWSRLGEAHGRLGEYREAIAAYEEAIRFRTDDAAAWNGLGAARLYLGRPRDAVPFFREALRLRPDFAEAWSDMGVAHLELGEHRQAVASFTEALRLGPDQPVAWNNLGTAWLEAGEPARAIPCFREALRLWPDYSSALFNIGVAYDATGRREERDEAYRILRQVDPEKAAALEARHGAGR